MNTNRNNITRAARKALKCHSRRRLRGVHMLGVVGNETILTQDIKSRNATARLDKRTTWEAKVMARQAKKG